MISRSKFFKLNLKQQLYKLAQAVRSCEISLKNHAPDKGELETYVRFFRECEFHPKREKAIFKIQELQKKLSLCQGHRSRISAFNFCYHELLELIGEPVGEKFFSVHRFDSEEPVRRFPTLAILDNIRSPFNVGSIFRSADCFGIRELALCGITLTPDSLKVQRTAMGTSDLVDWKYFDQTLEAIRYYRDAGYRIFAFETDPDAKKLDQIQDFENVALLFGNEEFGIPEEHLAESDLVVYIPLVGMKNSLNVANTFSVAAYQVLRRSYFK